MTLRSRTSNRPSRKAAKDRRSHDEDERARYTDPSTSDRLRVAAANFILEGRKFPERTNELRQGVLVLEAPTSKDPLNMTEIGLAACSRAPSRIAAMLGLTRNATEFLLVLLAVW